MSTSTDGILFWGIHFDEGEFEPGWEWEDAYAATKGVIKPTAPYEGNENIYSAYWAAKRDAVESAGCLVDAHCSGEYPMFYVAVKASQTVNRRGYPEEIKSLEVGADWEAKLRAFCEALGVPWSQPKWWLVSYWG